MAFWSVLALAFLFILEWKRPLLEIGGFGVSLVEVLVIAVIGLWGGVRVAGMIWPGLRDALNIGQRSTTARDLVPWAVWTVSLVAAAVMAPGENLSAAIYAVKIAGVGLLMWAVFDLVTSPARLRMMLRALVAAGVVISVVALLESTLPGGEPIPWLEPFQRPELNTDFTDVSRISATLPHPNMLAIVLEITLPLTMAWSLVTTRRWLRLGLWVGVAAGVLAMVLTLSRSGMAALGAGTGLAVLVAWVQRRRRFAFGGAATIGLLVVFLLVQTLLVPHLVVRFIGEDASDLWFRAEYAAPETLTAAPGETITVPVRVTNTGLRAWTLTDDTPHVFSYHLLMLDDGGAPVLMTDGAPFYAVYEAGTRVELPGEIAPGGDAALSVVLDAPPLPGLYRVEWDMLQVGVAWFTHKENPAGESLLTVTGPHQGIQPLLTPAPQLEHMPTPGRLMMWRAAWDMFRAHPLFGIGPRNYAWQFPLVSGADEEPPHTHNLYLGVLAETGLIGASSSLLLFGQIVLAVWRGRRTQQRADDLGVWWLAVLAGLASWLAHGLADSPNAITATSVVFWLLAGVALSLARCGESAAEEG